VGAGHENLKTGSLTKLPSWTKVGKGSELDPCLAWVQRERKAAANYAGFSLISPRCSDSSYKLDHMLKEDPIICRGQLHASASMKIRKL
jgi:hypothetical protein